jgi:hypothetical protein
MVLVGMGHLTNLTKLGLWKTRLAAGSLQFLNGLSNLEELILDDETRTLDDLALLPALPRLKKLAPHLMNSSDFALEQFRRANPSIAIILPACVHAQMTREADLEHRRLRRQGLTGRLRLAWRSLVRPIW